MTESSEVMEPAGKERGQGWDGEVGGGQAGTAPGGQAIGSLCSLLALHQYLWHVMSPS